MGGRGSGVALIAAFLAWWVVVSRGVLLRRDRGGGAGAGGGYCGGDAAGAFHGRLPAADAGDGGGVRAGVWVDGAGGG